MIFRLAPLRFSFIACDSIHFPEGKSTNILRGAFGTLFRRIACLPHCPGASTCKHRIGCPYARFFEPAATSPGPSGLVDHPRPFVFRAVHLDGQTFASGEVFHFDLNLFDNQSQTVAYLILTFAQLAHDGLGPSRRKVQLRNVSCLNEAGNPAAIVCENGNLKVQNYVPSLELDLSPLAMPVYRARVKFLSPTELKAGQHSATRPDFEILACRTRDRISTLRDLYGEGPLAIDFRAFKERASMVEMTRCDITPVDAERRSTRTGRIHSIGGFIGEAEYEGDLTEFVPFLKVAKWTGVGRQTVWGKGEISTES